MTTESSFLHPDKSILNTSNTDPKRILAHPYCRFIYNLFPYADDDSDQNPNPFSRESAISK
tara:strand:+ start:984 stop:1166 length:183 start_codon:yes stop_codon:yes gene_type:complete